MAEPKAHRSAVPIAGLSGGTSTNGYTCVVGKCEQVVTDKDSLRDLVVSAAEGARRIWANARRDMKTTHSSLAGKGAKAVGSLIVGGAVAAKLDAATPLGWAPRGFGPLPYEFTKSGAIQVFELSAGQRLGRVLFAAGTKFVLVAAAFEGGVLIGSIVNQFLPESTRDAIGGTINEIVNEEGYKELWRHPFGCLY